MKYREINVGDCLCDVHYGLRDMRVDERHKVADLVVFECDCGSDFIQKHLASRGIT